jgi:hypothetical protein
VKHLHRYAENRSRVYDSLLHTPEARVQHTLSIVGRGYESELEDHGDDNDDYDDDYYYYYYDDEGPSISGQESTAYISSESHGNSDWEIMKETEKSEEACASRRSCAATTTEETERGTEEEGTASRKPCAASMPQVSGAASSPEAVLPAADMSGRSRYGESQKCPICLETFAAQKVGTPDTCEHLFCTGCLEEWSAISNTCPVDRQRFNVILVRHYPEGDVIRRIPVRPKFAQTGHHLSIIFCALCGGSDRIESMRFCIQCICFYHPECLTTSLDIIPSEEWLCPRCLEIRSAFEVDDIVP